MTSWDRQTPEGLRAAQNQAVRTQIGSLVGPFSPYWRERFEALGRSPGSVRTVEDLVTLPAVGERDLCPDGDPAGMAALVLAPNERGWATHAEGRLVRRALLRRVLDRDGYRTLVETDARPTVFTWSGLAFRYPIAWTRADLDVLARAGARLWAVLGLSGADSLLGALPGDADTERTALQAAALAAGSPALFPGDDPEAVAAAVRLASPSVLAAPSAGAADLIDELAAGGADLSGLRTLLLVGAPSPAERRAAAAALGAAAPEAVPLAVHAPSGARLLWGECRESADPDGIGTGPGLHSYPDLEAVELVDPENAEQWRPDAAGELVITQLGLRGSALVRWRTGDVVDDAIAIDGCPACGRTVPRISSRLHRGALVARLGGDPVDLRAVSAALAGRADVDNWRLELSRRSRDGRDQLLVHLVTSADPADTAVAAAEDILATAGLLPTQLLAAAPGQLAEPAGRRLTRRIRVAS